MILDIWSGSTSVGFERANTIGKNIWINTLLTNNTASPITINLTLEREGTGQFVKICPKNLTLGIGETFELKDVAFQTGRKYKLQTTGSLDYYIILHEDYSKQW